MYDTGSNPPLNATLQASIRMQCQMAEARDDTHTTYSCLPVIIQLPNVGARLRNPLT